MKRLFLILAFIFTGVGIGYCGVFGVPYDQTGNTLQDADYGGFDVSTAAFSTSFTTITLNGRGIVTNVLFSTGNATALDFVDIFDSTAVITTPSNQRIARIYNIENSTGSAIVGSGPSVLNRTPIRFKRGCIWQASVATYNLITVIFYKEP